MRGQDELGGGGLGSPCLSNTQRRREEDGGRTEMRDQDELGGARLSLPMPQ
jgi:hypothetical protein